jgi:hypothetical protein
MFKRGGGIDLMFNSQSGRDEWLRVLTKIVVAAAAITGKSGADAIAAMIQPSIATTTAPAPLILPSLFSSLDLSSAIGIASALELCVAFLSSSQPLISNTAEALQAVVDFIGQDTEKQKTIGSTPTVITNVVKILQFSLSAVACDAPLRSKSLAAIAKLCRYGQSHDTICEQNLEALGTAGAYEAVVSALKATQDEPDKFIEVGTLVIISTFSTV